MFGVTVNFPIIEDPTMENARAYGMIGCDAVDAAAVRATYFFDLDGVLRASTCYPAEVGRSVDEMLRILTALQRAHDGACLAAANWTPGDELLRVPRTSMAEIVKEENASDWFYATVPDREQA